MGKITVLFLPIYLLTLNIFHYTMATDPVAFTKSISDFSADLYQNCIADNEGNIIISPLSVDTAVSLAFMGAKGKTAEEIASGLKLSGLERKDIAANFQQLLDTFNNDSPIKLANKIYIMNKYKVKSDFNDIATKQYRSEAQSLDFADSVNSAKTINTWVEDQTNNKIKDLVKSDSLSGDTRMVLVNAIYFKGFWLHQFKTQFTRQLPFYTSESDSTNVDMMYIKEKFNYVQKEDFDAIELPYKDSGISMLIVLPKLRMGLSSLEKKLNTFDFAELSRSMVQQEVEVSLPKFKIEFEIKLNDVLAKMGMQTMFSDTADFGDLIDSDEPLKVSEVIHKAFIEVNEEGVEAAAATVLNIRTASLSLSKKPRNIFNADHPFFFILKDDNGRTIFNGRLIKFN